MSVAWRLVCVCVCVCVCACVASALLTVSCVSLIAAEMCIGRHGQGGVARVDGGSFSATHCTFSENQAVSHRALVCRRSCSNRIADGLVCVVDCCRRVYWSTRACIGRIARCAASWSGRRGGSL